ncbi:Mut7-C RNAse domain-containing protein [Prosthecochloris sp.]|uniref:Mut7-C RNAse domain-containing protein n=1 Tax=Prosthecochloris sp. TaxID=290513 RepID=UPI002580D0C5|nr:Mut7-C RNAse domain-containing protein [Prosthecochloris sp.]
MVSSFIVYLDFSPNLRFFLKEGKNGKTIRKRLRHATTVKDVVESCGVPHTEIGLILVNGRAVDFNYHMFPEDRVTVGDVDPEAAEGFGLQLMPGKRAAFIADEHLSKLVRRFRVLGIDTLLFSGGQDQELLFAMQRFDRILLTRDRRLLMHRIVRSGYCIRSDNAVQQVYEVIGRFALAGSINPFSRCPSCNGLLEKVDKQLLMNQLEPKTQRYYCDFLRCVSCRKIYWHGSHAEKLGAFVADVVKRFG